MSDGTWVVNDPSKGRTMLHNLRSALVDASGLDVAVSFALLSGWEILEPNLKRLDPQRVRMLVTPQLAITQPQALSRALDMGVQLRFFTGRIYHPKVYLAYGKRGAPRFALVGSANMSECALTTSVEAAMLTDDPTVLSKIRRWFDTLFHHREYSSVVDRQVIARFEKVWRRAALDRARNATGRGGPKAGGGRSEPTEGVRESVEDILATVHSPIGTLSLDQAGNNIRNLERLVEVLGRYPDVSAKERSELKLLGLARRGMLTPLGVKCSEASSPVAVAEKWCGWVASESNANLGRVNPRLVSFKRAATRFWQLQPELRSVFLKDSANGKKRELVQSIELLCNGDDVVCSLRLDYVKRVARSIVGGSASSKFVRRRVDEYRRNKGSRGWKSSDRAVILRAWRRVSEGATG